MSSGRGIVGWKEMKDWEKVGRQATIEAWNIDWLYLLSDRQQQHHQRSWRPNVVLLLAEEAKKGGKKKIETRHCFLFSVILFEITLATFLRPPTADWSVQVYMADPAAIPRTSRLCSCHPIALALHPRGHLTFFPKSCSISRMNPSKYVHWRSSL